MSYDDLLKAGDIRRSKPTPRDIAGILGTAKVRLRHIQSSSPVPDVRYQLAYDVARAAAQAVMAAEGYRPTGASHHQTIFEFVRIADGGRWADETEFFDQARGKRRLCVYEQNGAILVTEAEEPLSVAERFIAEVEEWLVECRTAPEGALEDE